MKKLTVQNYQTMEGQSLCTGGNPFVVKSVIPREEVTQCSMNFVEVAPGDTAYGYHYHEMNEEIFYIISGEAVVRTQDGDVTLKSGDAITFPTGPAGTHVIRNASSTEKLIYIDFGTQNPAEIVHFPEMKKIMAIGPFSNNMYGEQ